MSGSRLGWSGWSLGLPLFVQLTCVCYQSHQKSVFKLQHPVFARLSVVIMLLHGSPVFLFPNSPVSPVWLTSNSLTRVTYLLPLSRPVPSWILLQNTRLTCLPTCLWSQLLLQNKPVVFRVFTAVSTSKQSHLHYQENLGASFRNLC